MVLLPVWHNEVDFKVWHKAKHKLTLGEQLGRGSPFSLGTFSWSTLRIANKIKPGMFDEKRGIAALLIKHSGFYFVRNPK